MELIKKLCLKKASLLDLDNTELMCINTIVHKDGIFAKQTVAVTPAAWHCGLMFTSEEPEMKTITLI